MTQVERQTGEVEMEVRIAAAPATVFSFLNDAARMGRWIGSSVELDPRPGGALRIDMNGRDIARGEIVAIEPDRRLVLSWGWEGEGHPVPPGSSTVEITLSADGDGTIVRLRHTGLPADAAKDHEGGWGMFLPRLVAVAERRDAGPNPAADR
jgi:uncharacterized protein YndB with AHSA1/START domain